MSFHWLLEDGSGAWLLEGSVAATVPAAPTIGTATAGTLSASVSFTPNSTGGSPITSFTLTANPGGTQFSGPASPINCSALAVGTYTFTVTATNAVGTSLPSGVSNAVTVTPAATVPLAPTIGTAVAGDGTATVSYTLLSDGGSPITSVTATSIPGGLSATGLANPMAVPGLTDGVAYSFFVVATNAIGNSPASGNSNSVTPTAAANFTLYANGNLAAQFPKTTDLSFGCTRNFNYAGSSPPPCPGSTQSLQVATNTAFGGGYQPGSLWTTIPPNGFDDSPYTRLQFSLYTPNPSSMYVSAHYSRATGNDIGTSTSLTQGSTALSIPANTWTTVTASLSSLGMLGAKNFYKVSFGTNASNLTFYLDNIKLIGGAFGWAFQGTGAPAAGWTDASVNATADYTWLPNSFNASLYAINNPANAASVFTASCAGTLMTVTAVASGTINVGDSACWQSNLGGSSTPVISSLGSGTGGTGTYNLSTSQTVGSQPWSSAPAQSKITGCKLTASVINGTLKLTHAGFDTTPYGTFTFGVIPTKSGFGYQVQFLNTSGVAVGNAVNTSSATTQHDFGISTGSFTVHNMLLSLFGAIPSTIGGFTIRETSGNAVNTTYFSAIGFTSP